MFGDGSTVEQRAARRKRDRSILDSLNGSLSRLRGEVSAADRARLDDYTENVREIERRLQIAMKASTVAPTDFERAGRRAADVRRAHQAAVRPAGARLPGRHHARRHAALRARPDRPDLSRRARRRRPASTACRTTAKIRGRSRCSRRSTSTTSRCWRTLIEKLAKTQDGDGTLLDHSLVLYGSNMGNSNQHVHYDVPHVLVGGAERTRQRRSPHCVSDEDRADRQPAADRSGQVRHQPGQHRRQRRKAGRALASTERNVERRTQNVRTKNRRALDLAVSTSICSVPCSVDAC